MADVAVRPETVRRVTHVPGEPGIWVLVMAEMSVFSVLFAVFVLARSRRLGEFEESRRTLQIGFGLANTVLLLVGSALVARGVAAVRAADGTAPRRFAAAALCGVAFLVDKSIEYSWEAAAGNTLTSGEFFRYFYVLTAVHAVHVVIGVVLLLYVWRITTLDLHEHPTTVRRTESIATFWHMVDLIWVVLFALLYLL